MEQDLGRQSLPTKPIEMKLSKLFSSAAMAVTLLALVTGCPSAHLKNTPLPNPGGTGMGPGGGLDSGAKFGQTGDSAITDAAGNHGANDPGAHAGYIPDAEALKSEAVYFDLDKSTIKPSEQSKLEAVTSYLKSNPDKALRVEGNCDERGTEEYNRSLGERRAITAREFLITSGIDGKRIDTLTNGNDKPASTGHDESAYSKNRRDEFIVLTPPR
jgi:peptidoglycan-associated lipoprotein